VVTKNYLHVNKQGLNSETADWHFPMYHLDIETIGPAIPRYPGTSAYNQVPFQFSVHIQRELNADLVHKEYLHQDSTDPRRPLAEKLVEAIPESGGMVVAFNARFEAGVLRELAKLFPDLANKLNGIAERLVDAHPAIKANVYHKDFRGGFGLKEIAPALLGSRWDYSRLEVVDGKSAQLAFDEMICGDFSDEERGARRMHLLKYCAQDTLAMVELVKWIYSNNS
jgi:hypothetical protein